MVAHKTVGIHFENGIRVLSKSLPPLCNIRCPGLRGVTRNKPRKSSHQPAVDARTGRALFQGPANFSNTNKPSETHRSGKLPNKYSSLAHGRTSEPQQPTETKASVAVKHQTYSSKEKSFSATNPTTTPDARHKAGLGPLAVIFVWHDTQLHNGLFQEQPNNSIFQHTNTHTLHKLREKKTDSTEKQQTTNNKL